MSNSTANLLAGTGVITPDVGEALSVGVYIAATVAGLIITFVNRSAFHNITRAKEDNPAEKTTVAALESAPPSFSRISGVVGVAYLLAFCWALGLYILTKVWHDPTATATVVASSGQFIMAGSALFAPYAFNQVSQVFGRRGSVQSGSSGSSGSSGASGQGGSAADEEIDDMLTAR